MIASKKIGLPKLLGQGASQCAWHTTPKKENKKIKKSKKLNPTFLKARTIT
jgi:hypothetical protein